MFRSILSLSLVLAVSFSSFNSLASDELIASFQTELKSLESLVADQKADAQKIEAQSRVLVEKGNVLLTRFAEVQKDCAPILKQVVADSEKMQGLDVEKIEKLYHQGEALPKSDKDFCYEAKEFVVHPATVTVLAKTQKLDNKTRGSMQAEIGELGHHLENVKILLEVEKAE